MTPSRLDKFKAIRRQEVVGSINMIEAMRTRLLPSMYMGHLAELYDELRALHDNTVIRIEHIRLMKARGL